MPEAEAQMETVMAVITGIRNVRGEMNIQPSLALDVQIQSADAALRGVIENQRETIMDLARVKSFVVAEPGARPESAATAIIENATIFVPLEGIIDFAQEAKRLEKEVAKVEKEMVGVSKKLNNEDFLGKAPDDVVEKVREKHAALSEKHQKLQLNLDRIKELAN